MFKKYSFLIVIFISVLSIQCSAQVVDVITGLYGPSSIAANGNDLYIIVQDPAPFSDDKVVRFDVTSTSPTTTDVVNIDGLLGEDILVYNNDLYITNSSSTVHKLNLSTTLPANFSSTTNIGGFDYWGTAGLAVHNNYLYVAENFAHIISRVNLTTGFRDTLVTNVEPEYILIHNNILYFTEPYQSRIAKVDLTMPVPTVTPVVTGLILGDSYGLAAHGSELYFAYLSQVRKVNLNSIPTATTTLLADLLPNYVYDLEFINGDLYISSEDFNNAGKISKIALMSTSTSQYSTSDISIYPNPVTDFIKIKGVEKDIDYKLYNLLGMELMKGTLSQGEQINVSELANGHYILNIINKGTFNIIKK